MSSSAAVLALIKTLRASLPLLGALNLSGSLYPPQKEVANNSCFEYIVVGGGTAGCAVSARLSEMSDNKVLLLEEGRNPPSLNFLPPAFPIFSGSVLDKNYTSTMDSYAASSQYGFTKLSAGKVLGGTSSINHFISVRASRVDYDNLAKLTNDSSWRYENVLPYFKKKEKLVDPEILDSIYREFHGLDGPGAITRQPKQDSDRFIEAFNETGSRTPLDITGNKSVGYTESLFIVNTEGIRQNTAFTYLSPIRLRENLYVLRSTTVILILFEGNRAVAVVAIRKGKVYVYRASKEIIICAGVFGSPKLLMLSGVGPKEHLQSLGIPVIANLPVGQNFQDQVSISLVHKMEPNILPPPIYSIIPFKVPFPVIVGLAALNKSQIYADYQVFDLFFSANTPFLKLACAVVFQFRTDLCDIFNKANVLHNSLYGLLSITKPKSRGHVKLRSTNPSDDPLITTGYYTNKTDLTDMVDYIIDYLKVENSTYFKKVKAELINPDFEQCKNFTFRSREYWECYVLHTSGSIYHNCGTCAITSVVDSKLRVYNIQNLRVIDASSIPMLTSASPYEDVQMYSEKGSDMIKADAGKFPTCRKLYGDDGNVATSTT